MLVLRPCYLYVFFLVAGEPLRDILNSGVRDKMEKAMLLLVQKSVSGAVDQERGSGSRLGNSISIEVLDDQGERIPENLNKKNTEEVCEELAPRKRIRVGCVPQGETSRRGVDAVSGGVNKTITIVGHCGIMTPTVDERSRKETFGVEVRPNERWIGGATVPLRAFQIFNLPQDANAYTERTRGDLANRCLSRAGRVTLFYFILF